LAEHPKRYDMTNTNGMIFAEGTPQIGFLYLMEIIIHIGRIGWEFTFKSCIMLGGPSYVGDQPLWAKRNISNNLCFYWQGAGHAQCVTCPKEKKKKIEEERHAGLQLEREKKKEKEIQFERRSSK